MRIYRVEHNGTRLGPWKWHTVKRNDCFFKTNGSSLPAMHGRWAQKQGMMPDVDRKFLRLGVRTLAQLLMWFDREDRKVLAGKGFVVRVYEVSELVMSDDYQVLVYIPARKRPIATHSLEDVA